MSDATCGIIFGVIQTIAPPPWALNSNARTLLFVVFFHIGTRARHFFFVAKILYKYKFLLVFVEFVNDFVDQMLMFARNFSRSAVYHSNRADCQGGGSMTSMTTSGGSCYLSGLSG